MATSEDAKKLNENALSTVNIDKNIFIMNRTSDDLPILIEKAIEKYSLRPMIFQYKSIL